VHAFGHTTPFDRPAGGGLALVSDAHDTPGGTLLPSAAAVAQSPATWMSFQQELPDALADVLRHQALEHGIDLT
jgi:hypothetical protein